MKGKNYLVLLVIIIFSVTGTTGQVTIENLPRYKKELSPGDWLIDKSSHRSALYQTPEGGIALSNGLITRTFSISPNAATIGLDNLQTNESLVRAVSPEATVWINGQEVKAGGLTGQKIGNYLLPEWIPQLKADPYSLQLQSFTTNPIKARMEWNRRTSWSPQHLPWPPKGIELTFTYTANDAIIRNFYTRYAGDKQREILLEDDFKKVSGKWKVTTVNAPVNAFNNEGKAGEILASPRAVVYGEQPLPRESQVIICKLNAGTDISRGSGPGLALVYPDGSMSGLYLSPGNQRFVISHKGDQESFEGHDPAKSWYLKMQLMPGRIAYSVSENGDEYKLLSEKDMTTLPLSLRIGKTVPQRGPNARTDAGVPGRSKIEQVLILGNPAVIKNNYGFLENLIVKVHYEIYDGIPLLCKWVTVENKGGEAFLVDNIRSEHLALTEAESAVEFNHRWEMPPVFAESDFAFGSMSPNASQNACVEWLTDSTYTTQVNYNLNTPTVLSCMPKTGIGEILEDGQTVESPRLWELVFDSYDRERRGLAQRKMYRTIAPWVTENPIIMHVSSAQDEPVKKAIDQCADVGFEMVIMTFGSGFNIEDTSAASLERMKRLKEYAASKGIALGGYSLLASRSIDKENDVVMPAGMKPAFGHSPCLESKWGQNYFDKLYNFYTKTGHDLLEHDGSYPGDVCASTDHPGHKGLEDSRWKQYKKIQDFYKWCRGRGIYLNVPDWYFLSGSTKVAMGYRETNWSLPRELQEIIERQNIYDGTWQKTPSMGWMFVPLVQYHGGGAAATIEPLKEHLPHYGQRLANLFGAGVQACYRGPQLYDAPQTRALVKKWVDFYKKHREVLDADIIHIRRPDGRDYDAVLHVNPHGKEKGLLMVYNPLNEQITRDIVVDVYYTGLKDAASVSEGDNAFSGVKLDGSKWRLKVAVPAKSQKWFVLAP
ncbi:MAG: hypothetical protein KIT80_03770 [Chitinophagaceae bacterium]|nr:hypothetical protein [Chitinophagaceae bacterium]MCW5926006.1 hypothetical protein [Chitinophagaceae bacterium]